MGQRRGFTLIELMVVMAVIAVLMGLLIPVISTAMSGSKKAETTATLQNIEQAIANYHSRNGVLPLFDEDLAAHDCMGGGDVVDEHEVEANNVLLLACLRTVDRDTFGPGADCVNQGVIVDAWHRPFLYRPFTCYPLIAGSALPHSDDPPRPDSYQLWSFGPDRTNDNGEDDDLVNWKAP
ncbi:MAG: prepilin-type N-terminal cleavage/methylation domain-containing protein [Planctomycetota bacterium]